VNVKKVHNFLRLLCRSSGCDERSQSPMVGDAPKRKQLDRDKALQ
jgi:hypothetical protein